MLRLGSVAVASAIALVLVCGPAPVEARTLRGLYDWVSFKTTRLLQREAFRAGLRIDADIDLLLTPRVDIALATVDGFEQLDLGEDAGAGAKVGFLFLRGHNHVPDGFYAMELVIEPASSAPPGQREAFARLIEARRGGEFRFPLRIAPSADLGLDPRKSLSADGRNLSVSFHQGAQTFSIPLAGDLDVRPLAMPLAQVGKNFITTFMTTNGMPPDSFTSSDPLPPGLTLAGSSLTGAPTEVGDYEFTIEASDSAGSRGARNYTLTVLPAGLHIITDALPNAVVNASYGAQVLAIGGIQPYRWRVESVLPDGLVFADSGFLNGRPTVTGTFMVTVVVQDQTGLEASADLSLTVTGTGLVSLLPALLPNGVIGAPYHIPILPAGGVPPYQCELVDGQLPPGLSLSGCATAVSGTPQASGVFGFTLRIRDSDPKLPRSIEISRHIRVVAKP